MEPTDVPNDPEQTGKAKPKTRVERQKELKGFLKLTDGLVILVNIYRTCFRGAAGSAVPPRFMIARILSAEFPDG